MQLLSITQIPDQVEQDVGSRIMSVLRSRNAHPLVCLSMLFQLVLAVADSIETGNRKGMHNRGLEPLSSNRDRTFEASCMAKA